MEIAFENRSQQLSETDALFQVAACDLVMRRDFAPAWGFEPWPCVLYKSVSSLPPEQCHPMYILDDIGTPNALGYHDDQLNFIYGRVLAQGAGTSVTSDHESKEMRLDPTCDLWVVMPNGDNTAREACDAVEGDTYNVDVTIAGETRTIAMSNFLLPAWFQADSKGPYDFMGLLTAPFTMTPGGYMIIQHPDGSTEDIFADHPSQAAAMSAQGHHPEYVRGYAAGRKLHIALKRNDATSRTYRRHARVRLAHK